MKIKKIIMTLIMVMGLCLVSIPVRAYDSYKVTISGGLHGTVNGKQVIEVEIAAGAMWNPEDYAITVTDDKYYFKGFHLSGEEGVLAGAQVINEDKVFVATYGVKGDLVEYYVEYFDDQGNELLSKRTYHGNIGDKPVVAHVHIDGYVPNTYNYTGTIPDPEDGILTFRFTYTPMSSSTTVVYEEGETIYVPGQGGNAGGGGGQGAQTTPENEVPEPAEIIDIDDEETPTADPNAKKDEGNENIEPEPAPQGISFPEILRKYVLPVGLGLAALIAVVLLFLRRKNNGSDK